MPKLSDAQREHMAARRGGRPQVQDLVRGAGGIVRKTRRLLSEASAPARPKAPAKPAHRFKTQADYQAAVDRAQAAIERFRRD